MGLLILPFIVFILLSFYFLLFLIKQYIILIQSNQKNIISARTLHIRRAAAVIKNKPNVHVYKTQKWKTICELTLLDYCQTLFTGMMGNHHYYYFFIYRPSPWTFQYYFIYWISNENNSNKMSLMIWINIESLLLPIKHVFQVVSLALGDN